MADKKSGIWADDPAKGAAIGTEFKVQWMYHYPLVEKGAGTLDDTNWTHFDTALLALSFTDGSELRADGSAALVGPGLAVAARHVLDPIMDDLLSGALSPMAASMTEHGVVLWSIHQIIRGDTDVALLRLNLASDFPPNGLRCATLSTRTPAIGEPIMIAGVRGQEAAKLHSPLGLAVHIGVGEVSAIYPRGRDRVILPHACLEVRCLTMGGMSGGPAFDKNGHLVGILTSSLDDEEGPSFVSCWWPTAGDGIETVWPPGIIELPTNLLELTKVFTGMVEGAEALTVSKESDGTTTVSYKTWS